MFNAEPQEKLTAEEIAEFEADAAEYQHFLLRRALYAGILLLVNILCIVPFLAGHSLHSHWYSFGKYLILSAELLLLWFVIRAGFVWAAWQSTRETRREFRDPD
jgi:hypothetical protein